MRITTAVLSSIVFVSLSVSANATFMVIDDDLVYDTSNDLYFQRNYLAYSGLTYSQIVSSVESSTVGGLSDWNLASREQMLQSSFMDYDDDIGIGPSVDDLMEFFQPSSDRSDDIRRYYQWDGVIANSTGSPETTLSSVFITGIQYDPVHVSWDSEYNIHSWWNPEWEVGYGSWVVSSGPSSVPEPAAMLLLGAGLAGLALARFREKK